jgi:acyl carrier protein
MENLNREKERPTMDLLARVQKAFNITFETDPQLVSMRTVPEDIDGWDSLGHVTLASNLEQEFQVNFDVDELMEMENVRAIVKILEAKLGG